MSRWGNARFQEEEGLDFARLLEEKPNGAELLITKNLLAEAKAKISKFTQKIIEPKSRHLLYDLIDIAVNPPAFTQKHQVSLDKNLTHAAIEILSNLTQEFLECIFDEQTGQEDDVIQQEKEYAIMNYILRVLSEERVENTGLAYLNKLVSPFIYQRPAQMLQIITQLGSKNMLIHFGSQSICELLTKGLEAESEKEFYQSQKLDIVIMICQFVRQQQIATQTEEILESFYQFIEFMVQKHQDKYEKSKYVSFIRKVTEQGQHFLFLVDKLEEFGSNTVLKIEILHCIDAFLRMHLSSIVGSKMSGEHEAQDLKINEQFIKAVVSYFEKNNLQSFTSESRRELLSYYKLLKTVVTLHPAVIDQLLTNKFLSLTLDLMQKDPQNNILHNLQRDVIITGIHQSQKVTDIIKNEIGLQILLSEVLSNRNSNKCYENQLFLIAEAIKIKSQEKESTAWSHIESTVQSKRSFYSVVIGGNPRQQKWDSFNNEIFVPPERPEVRAQERPKNKQMVTTQSNLIDDMTGDEVISEEDLNYDYKNDHFFDSELPLDSDKSDEGDIRIMIHSTEEFQESYHERPVTTICESIIIIPVKQEIEFALKLKYGLTLSGKEQ